MTRLGDMVQGRENNLDLIRLMAAIAVLVSHAWPITQGMGTIEPLQSATGKSLGTLAVMVFFGLSGFLITASFQNRPDPIRFCVRRARRLWPGLLICLFLTVFCLGPMVSGLGAGQYFLTAQTWDFLVVNGSLLGFRSNLPGVFGDNAFPAVAGSIWTLPYEVICYFGVLGAGLVGLLANRRRASFLVLGCLGIVIAIPFFETDVPTRLLRLAQLGLPFVLGAAAWIWRDRIWLSPVILFALTAAAVICRQTPIADLLLATAITYGTLLLGYGWFLRRYVKLPGDYSYGLYIYAFPIQGLVMHLAGPLDPLGNVFLALPLTLMMAILSWHLVERPWLKPSRMQTSLPKNRPVRRPPQASAP